MKPDTSVIVVSYRPGTWLEDCLRSVVGQAGEVVVVDNGSPSHEASHLARRAGARPVRLARNRGFAAGVAAGLSTARGEIVGLLNDDATAGPNWLSAAAAVLEAPEVAAVTPKVLLSGRFVEVTVDEPEWFAPGDARPLGRQVRSIRVARREVLDRAVGAGLHELENGPDGRWRWTAGPKPFYVPAEAGEEHAIEVDGEPVPAGPVVSVLNHAGSFLRGHGIAGEYGFGAPDDGRFDGTAERFGFSGTAPVFRASTLHRLGAFATRFFAYNEDTDWCLRARLAGMRVVYDPAAEVRHLMSATSGGTASSRVRHLSQRNALLCLVRNAPLPVARPQVEERLRRGWSDPVARDVAARLPRALLSRAELSRRWVHDPADVWRRWADVDLTWDDSPAKPVP